MENITSSSIMTRGLKKLMRNCSYVLLIVIFAIQCRLAPKAFGKDIDAVESRILTDKHTIGKLSSLVKKNSHQEVTVESKHIVIITYRQTGKFLVPVKINSGINRGCYLYVFDTNEKLIQDLLLSELGELEACEVIKPPLSCNRYGSSSGVVVLYGKRLGSDNYWYEGSFLVFKDPMTLIEDRTLSEKLTDIDALANARKKLNCK